MSLAFFQVVSALLEPKKVPVIPPSYKVIYMLFEYDQWYQPCYAKILVVK